MEQKTWESVNMLFNIWTSKNYFIHIHIYVHIYMCVYIYIYLYVCLYMEEGNGNPLQYSCLENPLNRGAWWATVHRITQSWTWLKRPSMHVYIGEGNGKPLHYYCLENPRDGGAWWTAVYGVKQSRTRLKWLSSNISVYTCVCIFKSLFKSIQFKVKITM